MSKGDKHIIDEIFQKAFASIEVPYNPTHWDTMSQKLDALDAQDAVFDETFKHKLSSIEPSFNPQHWAEMSQKLTALDAQDSSFDEILRHKVAAVELAYNPQHWEKMADALAELEKSDVIFDSKIQSKARQYEPSYKSSHWEKMAQRLESEYSWKSKIVRFKVVELALMVLLIFTAINYIENGRGSRFDTDIPSNNADFENNKEDKKNKTFHQNPNYKNTPTQEQPKNANNNKPVAAVNSSPKSVEANQEITSQRINSTLTANAQNTISPSAIVPVNNIGFDSKKHPSTEGVLPVLPFLKAEALSVNNQAPDLRLSTAPQAPTAAPDAITEAEVISTIRPQLLTINSMLAPLNITERKRVKWWVSLVGQGTRDIAVTYFKRENEKSEPIYRTTDNAAGGVAVGLTKGKWRLQTGLIWGSKKYKGALENPYTFGSLTKGFNQGVLESVKLDVLSTPLNADYTVFGGRRWLVYGQIGGQFNTIMLAKENKIESGAAFRSGTSGQSNPIELNTYEGLLDKRLLSNNFLTGSYYWTLQAGIGAEFKLSPRGSIYAQTNFHQHIGRASIGTLGDRISSTAIQIGYRSQLGKLRF